MGIPGVSREYILHILWTCVTVWACLGTLIKPSHARSFRGITTYDVTVSPIIYSDMLWNITMTYNVLFRTNWTRSAHVVLEKFERRIHTKDNTFRTSCIDIEKLIARDHMLRDIYVQKIWETAESFNILHKLYWDPKVEAILGEFHAKVDRMRHDYIRSQPGCTTAKPSSTHSQTPATQAEPSTSRACDVITSRHYNILQIGLLLLIKHFFLR